MFGQQDYGKGPSVGLDSECRKQQALDAFGGDDQQVGNIGQHQQREQYFAGVCPDCQKIKNKINKRTNCTDNTFYSGRKRSRQQAQCNLQKRYQCDLKEDCRPGMTETVPEGIEGQGQIGQKVQYGVEDNFQYPV